MSSPGDPPPRPLCYTHPLLILALLVTQHFAAQLLPFTIQTELVVFLASCQVHRLDRKSGAEEGDNQAQVCRYTGSSGSPCWVAEQQQQEGLCHEQRWTRKFTRERWIVNADGGQTSLPPPNGAQMTRRMALTQSSMSVWELAMSRKDSWLIGARSFSPVPPVVRGEGERRMRWTKDSPGVKRRHKSSPEGHRRLTGSLIN